MSDGPRAAHGAPDGADARLALLVAAAWYLPTLSALPLALLAYADMVPVWVAATVPPAPAILLGGWAFASAGNRRQRYLGTGAFILGVVWYLAEATYVLRWR